MEDAVVDAELVGHVSRGHGVVDAVANTHRPVDVLGPVGGVGAADISHGTCIVALAEEGLGEAGGLVELAGEAAVANHKGGHAVVGHGVGVANLEGRLVPSVPVAVGGVVDQANAGVVEITELGAGGVGAAIAIDSDPGGGVVGVVLIIGNLGVAVGGVDIVVGDVVHGGVGITPGIVVVSM